jgi:hypothetical protein
VRAVCPSMNATKRAIKRTDLITLLELLTHEKNTNPVSVAYSTVGIQILNTTQLE